MRDREFENYLALLSGMLRLRRTQREGIAGELRDHLIEHVAHLEASGITHEEAVRRALEEFGDAAALAANFSALVGMRRRRLIMRCTIGTTVVMTGLVVAMLAFRPPVVDDPSIVKAQQAGQTGAPATGTTAPPVVKPNATSRNDEMSATTRRKLDALIDVEFKETPFGEVLKYIGAKLDVQFYLDGRSLSDIQVNSDTPVTLQLNQVPAEMAIELLLQSLQLGYTVRSGVVMVLSTTALESQAETRVYHLPHDVGLGLTELIPATLAPTTWDMVGGAGSIRVFYDSLVITQTPEVHLKVEKLLKDLEPVLAQRPKQQGAVPAEGEMHGSVSQPGYGATGGSVGGRYGGSRGAYGTTRAYGSTGGYGAPGGYGGSGTGYGGAGYGGRGRDSNSPAANGEASPLKPPSSTPAERRDDRRTNDPAAAAPVVPDNPFGDDPVVRPASEKIPGPAKD